MITMLVSLSSNFVIGLKGTPGMLWDSEVNNKFLQTNMDNENLVMGHNTFKHLKKEFVTGKIIVLSKKEPVGERKTIHYYNNVSDIIKEYSNFMVIGGDQIYNLFFPVTDQIIISMLGIEINKPNNIYFPISLMEDSFYKVEESNILSDIEQLSKNKIKIIFSRWHRRIQKIH